MKFTGVGRATFTAAFFLLSFVAGSAVARADAEFCPASVAIVKPVRTTATETVYAYQLSAKSVRSVSGTVYLKTQRGWFTFGFPATQLASYQETWSNSFVKYKRYVFESPYLYVAVPPNTTILGAFVGGARATGDAFGWEAKGAVTCSAPAGFALPVQAHDSPPDPPMMISVIHFDVDVPANVQMAAITAPPGDTSCAQPFTSATALRVARLQRPMGMSIGGVYALIQIVLNPDSSVADAWVYSPTGDRFADEEAIDAAKATTYKAGTAFCAPAPGEYLFKATFN